MVSVGLDLPVAGSGPEAVLGFETLRLGLRSEAPTASSSASPDRAPFMGVWT